VIALVGFMGAGKTTVGRLVAERLGRPFVDLDREIERTAGSAVAAIFETEGEERFRALERAAAGELLGGRDAVVALGGGAVEHEVVRNALAHVTTVHLEVELDAALARSGDDGSRPMLAEGDPSSLYARRRPLYERLADFAVETSGRTPEEVADEIVLRVRRAAGETRTTIATTPSYDVVVGRGLAHRLDELAIPFDTDAETAFVVTHEPLRPAAEPLAAALTRMGLRVAWGLIPEGESAKTLAAAERLFDEIARAGVHRHDVVVAFGGGVVGDVVGFVASTYHRGVDLVQVPTTLLAQVDAAIGGKTAVNLPHGKNLVGTFHQPRGVVCDVALLETLPKDELRSGMAEIVKYGLIADPDLLASVTRNAATALLGDLELLQDLVARSVAIKGAIVAADEREHGARASLNYGHTFAHALERSKGFGELRHGEAVSLGMLAAAYLAQELALLDERDVAAHRRALEASSLPTRASCDLASLERAWQHDKKYRRGVRFVLLHGLGRPVVGVDAPRHALERAIERLER
jgi:shikimate kinase/3-dehydroquinate synthase